MIEEQEQRSELQSVRELLRDWCRWKRGWWPHLGYPGAVAYIDQMRSTFDSYTEGEDYDRIIDAATMNAVDRAIEKDLTPAHRAAVMVVYLNELGPAVWRSNRVPLTQVHRLCDEAERALVVALRRREVRL